MSDIILETKLELIDNLSFLETDKEAFASISLNPTFQWAKIVVTDDQPNANKNRVPLEEFDNVIKTGIFAPIKMAESEISRGHQEAMGKPIGTIAQLVKVNNKIIALAALWKRERPDEIELLKTMYKDGNPPNVSWELSYAESKLDEGIETLYGISLNGLAVVNAPAYSGRTPFIAMASDQLNEEDKVEEELKQKISELETELEKLKMDLTTKDAELDSLRQYKQEVEAEKSKITRLAEIKQKFEDAKIEKDENYWNEKAEVLLKLDDASINFMIQELVSFSEATASTTKVEIPNLHSTQDGKKLSGRELGKALRELKLK
jgi:hypothetical protein